MRGISYFTPSNSARAVLLSAMLLAGATLTPLRAQGLKSADSATNRENTQNEETAFAVPRQPSYRDPSNGLPHPLSAADVAALRDIFRAQRAGDFESAAARTKTVHDDVLLGDVLADRYLNPAYHPQPAQLQLWLKTYPTLADASALHALLINISPKGSVPPASFPSPLTPSVMAAPTMEDIDPLAHAISRNPLLDKTVNERVSWGAKGAQSAIRLIDATPGMTPLYSAQLHAEIALNMLSAGESDFAFETGRRGFQRSDKKLGFAAYVAGLGAWRGGKPAEALPFFESASRAALTPPPLRAAAAFWAARAQKKLGEPGLAASWLHRAAASTGTFYGILAQQALGAHRAGEHEAAGIFTADDELATYDPIPVMGEIDVDAVEATPQGRRLFALLQIGEGARAEALLRRMWPDIMNDNALCHSVQLVAAAAGMHDLSEQIATILAARDGRPAHVTGFPVPHLTPRHGFRMDPALIYALARLESNFDPHASSGAGAHGLMQIRPLTASFVTGPKPSFDSHGVAIINVPPDMIGRLHNPAVNLEIGQLYVMYLASLSEHADEAPSGGDLVRMLASYNAGPGAIAHWEGAAKDDAPARDPLLYMETLPNAETRDYVHHAFTYLWIYADKFGLPAPSLHALAHAEWPRFADERALASERVTFH
ncbi:transglycosylase SLT domain-containing protein [Kozakia baliensis]|uniref:transglycosylase SLT domain-containing protein n=1 Tax=Kozakia baliensis TaxID=153496 RepID=UPI00345BAB44